MADPVKRLSKRHHATIKEVAERAGVSQMTVSRVLNQRDVVKEATRLRVEEAIRDLNYRPNLLARSLAGGKSLFIGLVFNNPSNSYLGELLVGALHRCREAGHHLVIEDFSNDEDDKLHDLVERVGGAGLDGVIVAPPFSEDGRMAEELRAAQIQTVMIAPRDVTPTQMSVSIDDTAAAQQMAQYLIDHGHRRIGFVRGPDEQSSARRRLRGFEEAMRANGIIMQDELMVNGQYTYRSGMEAGERLLKLPKPPTAVFASNDDMAAGVVASAHRLSLRVPEDLSVVGFDDTPIASAIWPQLTTVRQPIAEMAYQAVTLLAKALDPQSAVNQPKNAFLDIAIVERGSVKLLS